MARTKGSYSLSANIEINAAAPLDARERVATLADLTAEGSFPYHYVGMETYVVATGKKYRLTGSDPTVSANWSEIGEGGSGGSGHTIENASGTDMTARSNLQFKGAASVSDDSGNDRTVVEVPIMPSSDMSEIISPLPTPPAPDDLDDLGDVTITTPANGQVLKYNSSSSKWENANESGGGGSTVSITPALQSGTKVADYEIDGTSGSLYAPTPTDVIANPSGTATSDLTKLQVGSTVYGIPEGTTVVANPSETATTDLTKLQVGSTVYNIPDEDTDALADLTDVAISSATNGQVLKYNSTSGKWANADESGGTGGHVIEDSTGTDMTERANLQFKGAAQVSDDSTNDRTVVNVPIMPSSDMSEIISPLPTPAEPDDLDDLGDVTITAPTNGQVLKYDSESSKWVNANESGGGGGTGGHVIEDSIGTDMTARANLQFTGVATVSDDSTNDRTIVDVPAMPSSDMSEIINPLPTPGGAVGGVVTYGSTAPSASANNGDLYILLDSNNKKRGEYLYKMTSWILIYGSGPFDGIIYDHGSEGISITVIGGTKNYNSIALTVGGGTYTNYAVTDEPIDVTDYDSLSVTCRYRDQDYNTSFDISSYSGDKYISFVYVTDSSHNECAVGLADTKISATTFRVDSRNGGTAEQILYYLALS